MSDDTEFGLNVIWQQTMDAGRFLLRVERVEDYTGMMKVIDRETDDIIYQATVPLAYGARFGPDADDVVTWQAKTMEVVDDYIEDSAH